MKPLTYREKLVCHILLMISRIMCEDAGVSAELLALQNRISAGFGEPR